MALGLGELMPKLIDFNKFGLKWKGITSAYYFETKKKIKMGVWGEGGGFRPPFPCIHNRLTDFV